MPKIQQLSDELDLQQQCPLGDGCSSCPLPGSGLADDFVPLSDGASLNLAVQDASAANASDALANAWQQDVIQAAGTLQPAHHVHNHGQDPQGMATTAPSTVLVPFSAQYAGSLFMNAAQSSLPSWPANQRDVPGSVPIGGNLTLHPGGLMPLRAPQHQSWMISPHSHSNWCPDTTAENHAVDPSNHPSDSVQALIASCSNGEATTALDSVAAVAMDLIKQSNWRCMWKQCSGVVDHGDTVQQHILKHVANTVQKAQSCKMNPCTGRHLKPGQEHLSLHLADVGFNPGSNIRCSWEGTCTRRFASADKYRRHIETHIVVDSSRYDCGWRDCVSHGFSSFHELLNHGLTSHVHTNTEQASTPLATTKRVAGQETNCQWENCYYEGELVSGLQEHVVTAHGDWCSQLPERVVVCRWGSCRRFFTDKTKFAHHMCTHSGMRFYQCEMDECEQGFTSESQRRYHRFVFNSMTEGHDGRAHVRRHHEKSFKCDTCLSQGLDKGYSSGFNLREHIRITHEKKPLICDTCSRPYQSHKAWSAHQRSCQAAAPLVDRRNAQLGAGQPY